MVDGFSLGDPSLTVLAVVLLLSLRGDIIDIKPDGLRASLHFSTWVCCLAGLLVHRVRVSQVSPCWLLMLVVCCVGCWCMFTVSGARNTNHESESEWPFEQYTVDWKAKHDLEVRTTREQKCER